jgi:hypothetical protein
MNRLRGVSILLAFSLLGVGCMSSQYAQSSAEPGAEADTLALLTNQDVIALAKAQVGDDVIIELMRVSGSDFWLGPQDVIALADSGVSDKVISAMIKAGGSAQYTDRSRGYYYYPPYYWYADYPFWAPWYPWYPSSYLGFSLAYTRPHYLYGRVAPHHIMSGHHGFSGRHVSGGSRSSGRHR